MPVIGERAEVRVYRVKVGSSVAVIGVWHCAVGSDRGGPYCRDAKLLKVIKMLLDARQVSAMPTARGGAIITGRIVGCVSVREAVGHDEVKHVGRREAAVAIGLVRAFGQHIGAAQLALVVACRNPYRLRRGKFGFKPQKGPMAVFRSLAVVKGHALAAQCKARMVQSLAMNEEHGVGQTGPPAWRVDLVDTSGRSRFAPGNTPAVLALKPKDHRRA